MRILVKEFHIFLLNKFCKIVSIFTRQASNNLGLFSVAKIMSMTVPCVLYKDRVFCGNLTTHMREEDILDMLVEHGFEPG